MRLADGTPETATPNRALRWWDLACVGVLAFISAVTIIDGITGEIFWASSAPAGWRVALLTAPALLFAVLYVTLGRGAILHSVSETALPTRTGIFFISMLLVLALGTFCDPMYAMLQALIYPLVWSISRDYRSAVLWCFAVAIAVGAGIYLGLVTFNPATALVSSLITSVVSLVFAIAMGTWISRIHDRGETYRELAEQLSHSQDEVAALSEAAGASAERERMSRDLHDTLTQTLAGLVMLSEQAERAIDSGDSARAQDRLARVGSAARAAVTEARALVATTQPIGDGGLVNAIERVAASLRADTELEVNCELERVQLSRESEVVLLRVVQEGLANARKHSRATRITVSLSALAGDGVRLLVDDDGVGPGSGSREGGFGLTGLADRVRAVGGELRFGAGSERGSRLEVRLRTADPAELRAQSGERDAVEPRASERHMGDRVPHDAREN